MIVFLDNGINIHTPQFDLPELAFDLQVILDEHNSAKVVPRERQLERLSHATICAEIFHHYAPDISIGSIQVVDDSSSRGTCSQLCAGLNWCILHQQEYQIEAVNISIGSTDLSVEVPLHREICVLAETGCRIISARSNQQAFSFPCCFPEVIGVRSSQYLHGDTFQENPTPYDGVDYLAAGGQQLPSKRGTYRAGYGSSYAAPLIAALLLTGRLPERKYYNRITNVAEHYDLQPEYSVIQVVGRRCLTFAQVLQKRWQKDGYSVGGVNLTDDSSKWLTLEVEQLAAYVKTFDTDAVIVAAGQRQDICSDCVITLKWDAKPEYRYDSDADRLEAVLPEDCALFYMEELFAFMRKHMVEEDT